MSADDELQAMLDFARRQWPLARLVEDQPLSCRRGCPDGECYCSEPTYASLGLQCRGCGSMDGDCYCGEPQ